MIATIARRAVERGGAGDGFSGLLGVCPAGPRDLAIGRARPAGDVRQRDDADQALVAVDHGKPPHLQVAHVLGHMGDAPAVEALFHVARHDLAGPGVRPFALGDGANWLLAVS